MKIALVAAVDPEVSSSSGVRSYVLKLGQALSKMGEEVVLLGLGKRDSTTDGIELVPVAPRVRNSAEFVLALSRFLRQWDGDVAVIHAQRPDDLIPFHLRLPGVPKVVTLHGVHSVHVQARRGRLVASAYRRGERYSLERTRSVLAVSRATQEYFAKRYPQLAARIRFIPAGIDFELFSLRDGAEAKRRLGIPPEDKLVTFVGRLAPEKRPFRILEEFESLHAIHPDTHLLMVGDGPLEVQVRKAAAGVVGSTEIRGPVPQIELAQILSGSDLLVVASTHEGLPTVVLEALACGTPVVGTEVGILPDVIRPGVNGYLAATLSEIGALMEKALYETTWVRADCRASVRVFGWNQVAPAILEVYREIAG
ncbi:MAG TPA: glycosyltransferase family 4 protein [Thermoplasmata archaeon]|nr:glycosyltransferase family 4 protein [Thermoplasmata archaeon]